jgi:hypothetical protein
MGEFVVGQQVAPGLVVVPVESVLEQEKIVESRDRLLREVIFLRQLERCMVKRHAYEPKHSREDHECEECTVLADLQLMRRH